MSAPPNADQALDPASPAMAIDPICGMNVAVADSQHTVVAGSETVHFCSAHCRSSFIAAPRVAAAPVANDVYTCPMHPQIRHDGPGSCPICGMALEPLTVSADEQPNVELLDMTRRLWIGGILAVPVFFLEMGSHIAALDVHRWVSPAAANWIEFVLSTPVVLWAGWPFFERGWMSLVNRSLNMFSLIALGTGAAYMYSVVATVVPAIFPA